MFRFAACLALIFTGCATVRFTKPTPYQVKDESGFGLSYNDLTSEEGFSISVFEGNTHTKPEHALRYSLLGAYERCHSQGMYSVIQQLPVEFSGELTRTQVTTLTSPGPVAGSSAQPVPARTYAYPVTVKLPKFATTFRCVKVRRSLAGQPQFEAVSRDLVHSTTQDFMGGILVRGFSDEEGANIMKVGDVILEIAGKRVEAPLQIELALTKTENSEVLLKVIRKNKIKPLTVPLIDLTDTLRQKEKAGVTELCRGLAQDNLLPDPCLSL